MTHAAVRSCRFCPMCHHGDLTVTLERRETYSARGRGLTLFALEQGVTRLDTDVADVMYRFFADGLNRQVCASHIPHDDMVLEARRELVAAGHAPQAVSLVRSRIEMTGNPWGQEEPSLLDLAGARRRSEVLVYFGAAARIRRRTVITSLSRVLKRAAVNFSVLEQEGDCGLLLYQLGDEAAAVTVAQALAERIARSGARIVITPDADAYRAFKLGFGKVPALSGVEVWHASQFLMSVADRLTFRSGASATTVVYHDACALARFATCLDAPRQLIQAVSGQSPLEVSHWSRELANCSGECGGVPFTFPILSRKAAVRRSGEARDTGANLLVTASPAAAVALDGTELSVLDLCEYVSEHLE